MYNYVSNVSIQTLQIDILFFVSVFLVKIMTLAVMNFFGPWIRAKNEFPTWRGDVDETGCAGRESLSAFSMPWEASHMTNGRLYGKYQNSHSFRVFLFIWVTSSFPQIQKDPPSNYYGKKGHDMSWLSMIVAHDKLWGISLISAMVYGIGKAVR